MHLAPLHTSLCYLALCKTLVPLALLQPASYALSWDSLHCRSLCRSIRICLYPISQFLLLHIWGSRSKVSSKRLGTSRILPLLLGTINPHHPTSCLEVWLHAIPQPTWLEVSPYWRSLDE